MVAILLSKRTISKLQNFVLGKKDNSCKEFVKLQNFVHGIRKIYTSEVCKFLVFVLRAKITASQNGYNFYA